MSALGDVAASAGGALAGQLWKVSTLVLAAVLLVGGGAGAALWWAAASVRDQALIDLKTEQGITAQLRAGVDDQNKAIQMWYRAYQDAAARGDAGRQAAEASGRRYDQALQQLAGARYDLRRRDALCEQDAGESAMIVNLTKLAGLVMAVLLTSCAGAPAPATQTVQVPVAAPCAKASPIRPAYEFDQLPATASNGDKILALVRDWARYRKYTGELEAVVTGCI